MSRQFDLIVFDWDGTLADSTGMIAACIREAAEDAGLAIPTLAEARSVIGLGLQEAISMLLPDIQPAQRQLLVERYRYHYYARDEQTALFEGAYATVEALKQRGHLLAVATGKGRNGLNTSLHNSGLGRFMDATRCVDECFSKPHPQMLLELMDELDVPPARTLMIGDTSFDMQMADNAAVARLAVGFGAHPMAALQVFDPVWEAHTFDELSLWLLNNA